MCIIILVLLSLFCISSLQVFPWLLEYFVFYLSFDFKSHSLLNLSFISLLTSEPSLVTKVKKRTKQFIKTNEYINNILQCLQCSTSIMPILQSPFQGYYNYIVVVIFCFHCIYCSRCFSCSAYFILQ